MSSETEQLHRQLSALRAENERLKAIKAELRKSEERFRSMFESHNAIMLLIEPSTGAIVDANQAAERFYGYAREQLQSMNIYQINTLTPQEIDKERQSALQQSKNFFIFPHRLASGQIRTMEVHSSPIQLDGRTLLFSILHDITERHRLEEQLLQARKMESIGRLAGGVAHDFNNLLTGIRGFSELASIKLPPASSAQEDLQQIRGITDRAAGLVRKLLTFARKEHSLPRSVNLCEWLHQITPALRKAIARNIELEIRCETESCSVWIDTSQFEQVLLNLVENACDVMPEGGRLSLKLRELDIRPGDNLASSELPPGSYILLSVQDTGAGIPADHLPHLFEPFFTTKPAGEGIGLGLATCYGIVRQHQGNILVESKPGQGSSFHIYLPSHQTPARQASPPPAPQAAADKQTLLIAEDELVVRTVLVRILRKQGYHVLEATDGVEALELAQRHAGPIHLLLTDMVMPRLGGLELAQQLGRQRPAMKTLYMSGYSEDLMGGAGAPPFEGAFIQKPFSIPELTNKVRALLEPPRVSFR